MILQTAFSQLAGNYTEDDQLMAALFSEIQQQYNEPHRHYHTLMHLENLLLQLSEVRRHIQDWDVLLFSLFYHDIVYSPQQTDNEEQSAAWAEKSMLQLNIPLQKVDSCRQQILATKTHQPQSNGDTAYFTDADLSVLGAADEIYDAYKSNIRLEYSIYPDALYNPGRSKVLVHFLNMPRIFQTEHFYKLYETQARQNLQRELQHISNKIDTMQN